MQLQNIREKLRLWWKGNARLRKDKKKAIIVLGGLLAIVLILLSEWATGREEPVQKQTSEADYAAQLESRLAAMITSMDGAGKAEVMVTLRTGTGTIYARNDKTDSESRTEGERMQSEQEYVLVGAGSGETGLCLRTESPQVLGVAVVCEGGDNPLVCKAISDSLTATLGVSASHISVTKMRKD